MCFYCGSDLEEVLVQVRSSFQLQQEPEAKLIIRPCSSLPGASAAPSSAVTHVFMVSKTRPSTPGLWSLLVCGDQVPSPVAFCESFLMGMHLVRILAMVPDPGPGFGPGLGPSPGPGSSPGPCPGPCSV